jgi:hypothetical protein
VETLRADENPSTPQLPASNLAHLWPGLVSGSPEADKNQKEQSVAVMAAAVVSLRDYGLVQFGIGRKGVTLTVTGQAQLGGIEAELLAAAARETTVSDTIHRWFHSDRSNPWGHVNDVATKWGVRYGVFQDVVQKRKGIGTLLGDKHSYPRVPEVVTVCRPQADALAQRWRQFLRAEPELAIELMGRVDHAIGSREQKEGGGWGD